MPKRALVLAGGGARGAYQVGMLKHLVGDLGLDFEVFRGVSVGALNASFLAQASRGGSAAESVANLQAQVDALEHLWRVDITDNDSVYGERAGGMAGLAAGADSLYTTTPLWELMQRRIDVQAIRASGRDFRVGTVSLVSGKYIEWAPESAHFLRRVLASASIPVVFPFVRFEDEQDVLVDGGVRDITPLSSAFRASPDEVWVLLTSRVRRQQGRLPDSAAKESTYRNWDDNWLGTKIGGFDVLTRTIDILTDEIYLDDVRGALDWNEIVGTIDDVLGAAAGSALPPHLRSALDALEAARTATRKRHVQLNVIAPRQWFGDDNSATNFSPKLIRQAIGHGKTVASRPDRWVWPIV